MKILCKIENKKLKPVFPNTLKKELSKFREGEIFAISFSKQNKRREYENNILWGILYPAVQEVTGIEDIKDIHSYCKTEFLNNAKSKIIKGKAIQVEAPSTANLSVNDFWLYIYKVCQFFEVKGVDVLERELEVRMDYIINKINK